MTKLHNFERGLFWVGSILAVVSFILITTWVWAYIQTHQTYNHPTKFYKKISDLVENETWSYTPICEKVSDGYWICYMTFGREILNESSEICIAQFGCYEFLDINYYNCGKFWEVCS